MDLQHIPLGDLHISKLNMRHGRRKPEISDILPSIRRKGVQQPLLVRKEGDGFGVIAGRRRWFCLKEIEKDGTEVEEVPCSIMGDGDDAEAMEKRLMIAGLARSFRDLRRVRPTTRRRKVRDQVA